jgi:hypothetical protein
MSSPKRGVTLHTLAEKADEIVLARLAAHVLNTISTAGKHGCALAAPILGPWIG